MQRSNKPGCLNDSYISDSLEQWLSCICNNFIAVLLIADLISIAASFFIGFSFRHYNAPQPLAFDVQLIKSLLVVIVIALVVFYHVGLYHYQQSIMNLIEVRKVLRAVMILFLCIVLTSYYQVISISNDYILYFMIVLTFFISFFHTGLFKFRQYMHIKGFDVHNVLIYGSDELAQTLFYEMKREPKLGYNAILCVEKNSVLQLYENVDDSSYEESICNDIAECLGKVLEKYHIEELYIVISLYNDKSDGLMNIINLCHQHSVKLNFVPYLHSWYSKTLVANNINGIQVLSYGGLKVSQAETISKRVFDFVVAVFGLLLLSPLFIVIALAIRMDSDGKIFFKQVRVGENGQKFSMYKFRTMYTDTPKYAVTPQHSDDSRITRSGKLLRRTSLDELPQLFNVLIGNMSLVGPRPEMSFIVEREYKDIHCERFKVKPGITGVWQISADRNKPIHENISYDLFYIENRSFLLDFIILLRTLVFAIMAMKTH